MSLAYHRPFCVQAETCATLPAFAGYEPNAFLSPPSATERVDW